MSITYAGLDHVQVAAPPGCEAAARAFYGDLLGMPEVPKPAEMAKRGGCWFQCGAQQIHVGAEADFRAAKKAHPAIRLADRASYEALAYSRFTDPRRPFAGSRCQRAISSAKILVCAVSASGDSASTRRTSNGAVKTHCLTGTSGRTSSTKCYRPISTHDVSWIPISTHDVSWIPIIIAC